MNIWVILMWVIASLMACWSFSLFVRWVSEAVARKRKRLTSQRSTKSFWLGLVLMVVCAGVAVFAGYMAVYLEGLFTSRNVKWTTPIAIIGGSVGVFGIFLLILGIIGDRARGRVRCPKCWYDMSSAVGLQCPECGHWAKSEAQFGRTRRRRWAMAIGIVLVVAGGYPVVLNKKTVKYGPLAMMPTLVLMNWWEELPEGWIVRSWGSGRPGALQDRIRGKWIPTSKLAKFGDRLIEPTLTNKDARWDTRRTALLAAVYRNDLLWLDYRDDFYPLPSVAADLDSLLRLCALDTLNAMITKAPSTLDNEILTSFDDVELSMYKLTWSWILRKGGRSFESDQFPGQLFYNEYMRSPEIHTEISRALSDVVPKFNDERFIKLITDQNKDISRLAFRLTIDTGLIDLKPEVFFVPDDELHLQRSNLRFHLGRVLHLLTPDAQERAFGKLSQWIRSDDPAKRAYAVSSIQYLQNNIGYGQTTPDEPYQRVIADIIEYAIHDDRTPYTDRPKRSIGWIATGVITRYNTTGEIAFPILLDRIANGKSPTGWVRWPTNDPDAYEQLIGYWLDSFAEFANAENASTRQWIINNLPTQLGTPYDDQLDTIAGTFLYDADKRVRETALRRLKSREAFAFIPEEYDTNAPPDKP